MASNDFLSAALAPANFTTIAYLLALMLVISVIEALAPLAVRRFRGRLLPNLVLTGTTFAANLFFGAAIFLALVWSQHTGLGVLNAYAVAPLWATAAVVLALDLSTYLCHVAMHKVPGLWRFHRVHHADPAVDVTTAFRQHPGESFIRFIFLATTACAVGASPVAFGIYRSISALVALAEHANIRVPAWADDILSLFTTWPTFHKLHHARDARRTDSNYGNIFSFWDRLFFTFTPVNQGRHIDYGLDGFDDNASQSIRGVLSIPFRRDADRAVASTPQT